MPTRQAPARLRLLSLAAVLGLAGGGCIYARTVYYGTPRLDAPAYFDSRPVRASPTPKPLPSAAREATFALTDAERRAHRSFDGLLRDSDTRAFVALRDDRVIYERYFGGVDASTALPSFSVSKTVAALLIGCAIDDGLIGSVRQPLVDFVPELSTRPHYAEVTLEHLLRMTSGIDFDEESVAGAFFYYSANLPTRMYAYDVKWTPGTHYLYGSISTQILWDVLHRRLGGRTVTEYFEQRVWGPLGADHPAAWSLDSAESGVEKLFGGFSATARDHARLGLLFLHGGSVDGRPVVSPSWVATSVAPDPIPGVVHTADGWVRRGQYQWFLTLDGRGYYAKGYHGQYVFVVPSRNMVFVRFGEGYGDVDWVSFFTRLADAA